MKPNEIVELTKLKPDYKKRNLTVGLIGIVVKKLDNEKYLVLFFNEKNDDDYAFVEIETNDLKQKNETIPQALSLNEANLKFFDQTKDYLVPFIYEDSDTVELLVEKTEYAEQGIHKGAKGIIIDDYVINNKIEVDFSYVDDDLNYFGDIISVDINDIKKV